MLSTTASLEQQQIWLMGNTADLYKPWSSYRNSDITPTRNTMQSDVKSTNRASCWFSGTNQERKFHILETPKQAWPNCWSSLWLLMSELPTIPTAMISILRINSFAVPVTRREPGPLESTHPLFFTWSNFGHSFQIFRDQMRVCNYD